MIAFAVIALAGVLIALSYAIDDERSTEPERVSRRCLDRLNESEPHQ